jgi:hypothetical protein
LDLTHSNREASLSKVGIIGIDLAKQVFQRHGTSADGSGLVRLICVDVPVQRAWDDVEAVFAVGRDLVCRRSLDPDAGLTHPLTNAAVANVRLELFQRLDHPWLAKAAQADCEYAMTRGRVF